MTEYAWATQFAPGVEWRGLKTHYDIPKLQAGCMADERIVVDGRAAHPTQKPLALMQELLLPGMDSILDPFTGSGTTGVACIRTGRPFIGIEIEERYCEIAVKRMEDELNACPLFEPRTPTIRQGTLID
jgi:DNA modification methylase